MKWRKIIKYQGGKSKSAKPIAEIINNYGEGLNYSFVSLFCGACSIENRIYRTKSFNEIICNDINKYLIALFNALKDGYGEKLPDNVSRDEYYYVKAHKDDDKALTGFVGIACSFGGIWFDCYGKSNCGRNFADEGKRSLLKEIEFYQNVTFISMDYRDVKLPENCIIYADPPYDGKERYRYCKGTFDSISFWEYMRSISRKHMVFISELKAPQDFIPIWTKEVRRSIDRDKTNQPLVTEKLFIHKSQEENYKKVTEV